MKRITAILFIFTMLASAASAQSRKSNETYEHHQARILDAVSNAYVKPLVVDLEIDKSIGNNGKIEYTLIMDRNTAEVALGGDLENIHTYGTYMTAQHFKCDVVVAPTFNLVLNNDNSTYELSVIGFAGKYNNWKPAEKTDEWWIDIVNEKKVSDREKTNPVKK